MAKKKEPDAQDPGTWKAAPPESTLHPDDSDLDEVLSALPQQEACIELFRINAQGGRPLYLESVQPSIFNLAYVTGKFGGGRYLASAKYVSGERVKMPFEIEGEPIPVRRLGPGAGVEPMAVPSNAVHLQALLAPTHPAAEFEPAPTDMQGMFSVLVTLIKDMKSSKADTLKEMLMYKELFAANQPTGPQATVDQMTNLVMKGVELAGKAGGPGETNVWLEVARELKDPLAKAFDALQMAIATRGQQQPAHIQPAIAPPVAQPTAQSTPAGDPVNLQMLNQLRMALPLLVNGASKNAEPDFYADFILDQTPENLYPSLRDWLVKPDCLDMLAKIEPGVRYAQDWWIGLRSSLLEKLTEEVGNGIAGVQSPEDSKPSTSGPTTSGPAA